MKKPASPPVLQYFMKTTLSIAALLGALTLASAQTNTILYQEDWGTGFFATNTPPGGNPPLTDYGWSTAGGQYIGTYGANAGSFDVTVGVILAAPTNTRAAYLSSSIGSDVGFIYTTAGASGTNGDSVFASIDPTANQGLIFNVESQPGQAGGDAVTTNFFAVMVGGQWYVSTTRLVNLTPGGVAWTRNSLVYNPAKANWRILTIVTPTTPGTVTIGIPPVSDLTGNIDGIGMVHTWQATLSGGFGINYLNFTITKPLVATAALVLTGTGASSTNYVGGTAKFAVAVSSTSALTYSWSLNGGGALANGATGNGSTIFGATTSQITISNLASADAGDYSVTVSGNATTVSATNTLTVLTPGPELLYAETFPFVGPLPYAQSPTNVGWIATISSTDIPNRLDERGELYAYETAARTTGFFTATNLDISGVSGLAFPPTGITPASYPFVSFRATYAAVANAGNAAVYFAVQMAGGSWFVSTSANIPGATPANFTEYGLQFSPVASGWNKLTVGATSATVGTAATSDLNGKITGIGLVFVFTGPSLYLVNNVGLVTNSTPPVAPSFPSLPNVPYFQTIYEGGGASFSFTEAGTLPFTNHWQFNTGPGDLVDGITGSGSTISGSGTTMITIANARSADAGGYRGHVSNAGGTSFTDTGTFGEATLTVNPPPLGLIYTESFPAYAVTAGNQLLSIDGWTNQSDSPLRMFKIGAAAVGTYAGFAYQAGTTNSLFYGSTDSDTGFSGLPFIAFDPANYPANSLQFSASFAQGNVYSTNVSASFAVKCAGNWYVYATPVIPTNTVLTTAYVLSSQMLSFAAGQWQHVTLAGSTGVILGAPTTQPLSGPITAAGLLFQHRFDVTVPANFGGSMNWSSFAIQAIGNTGDNIIGSLNIGPVQSNGTVKLTWIGNAAVNLQSTTSLAPPVVWSDDLSTLGANSKTVSATGQKFYRITGPAAP